MTSAALQRGDRPGSHAGFDRIARELQDLAQQLEDQKLRSEAADELGDLVDALDGDQQSVSGATSQNGKSNSQNKTGQPGEQGKGENGETGEAQSGQSPEEAGEGQPGENGEPGQEGQPGNNPGGQNEDNPNGKGGNSFGGSTKSAPLEGDATTLEVQLEKEALKIDVDAPGSSEANKDVEAAGERERSKLDYRNAPSDLTPAQKDLLSQDHIPWERRQLIKNYFQAVKPTQTK
jgi:hypothetical protein